MLDHIAKKFVELKFQGIDEVMAVLLTGSTAAGYQDATSDIDLQVIATENLCSRMGDTCGFENYHEADIWWEWVTLEEVKDELKNWRNDIDLWVYSKSKILYDPRKRVEAFLSNYRQYPERVWGEKVFLYWFFATGHAPYDSGRAIGRGDLLTAQLYLNQAMEYYIALIFVLTTTLCRTESGGFEN